MKGGLACSLLGGILAFVGMATVTGFQQNVGTIAIYMLAAVAFFATAGGFTSTSQWNQSILAGFCFVDIALGIAGLVAALAPLWFCVATIVLGALCLLCAMSGSTAHYLNSIHKN